MWATSSDAGSITGGLAKKGAAATYSISKVALNMAMVKLARSLDDEKFTILLLHVSGACRGGGRVSLRNGTG